MDFVITLHICDQRYALSNRFDKNKFKYVWVWWWYMFASTTTTNFLHVSQMNLQKKTISELSEQTKLKNLAKRLQFEWKKKRNEQTPIRWIYRKYPHIFFIVVILLFSMKKKTRRKKKKKQALNIGLINTVF